MARANEFQGDDVTPEDADADVVKVFVRKVVASRCSSFNAWHLLQRPFVLESSQPRFAESLIASFSPAMK
jgi:hypothetical protein